MQRCLDDDKERKKKLLNRLYKARLITDRYEKQINLLRIRKDKAEAVVCDSIDDVAVEIDKLIQLYKDSISDELRLQQELEQTLMQVEDVVEQKILQYRYIDLLKWDDIADMLSYEQRQVFRKHDEAIKKLKI